MTFRHQLAAYSPISLGAAVSGMPALVGLASDPRPGLNDLLRAEYTAEVAVLCGSGTQALQLAIEFASRGRPVDQPVAIPAFGCFDLVSAAIGANAKVALYDVDPKTLAPDRSSLERVLAAGAQACVLAPLYGVPLPWDELEVLAARYGVPLIEDAAQGQGASWRGRILGSIGSISTISFGRGKGWTGGNGGAVLFRGAASTTPTAELRDPGARADISTLLGLIAQAAIGRPSLYGAARAITGLGLGETRYHPPHEPVLIARSAAAAVCANHDASLREGEVRRGHADWAMRGGWMDSMACWA